VQRERSARKRRAAIEAEIDREQAISDQLAAERDAELDLLRLAMTLAHNRGDLTQRQPCLLVSRSKSCAEA
jgi:hypothetical protein